MNSLKMWGSLESKLIRSGDSFISDKDKLVHHYHFSLDLLKEMGFSHFYYPAPWELIAPKDLDHCDWGIVDTHFNDLKSMGLEVISGFLNHGSGPLYTSLIDPDFPEKFSTYARHFITRYPWMNHFLLINDIQITAERSCLEGKYYPHLKDHLFYLKALINQSKATLLAMREIRRVNPKANFIISESVERHYSSDQLAKKRDFWNEKRWLAFDLISGRVDNNHPLYQYMIDQGIRAEELSWFIENSHTPQIFGINFHQERQRFFDHEIGHYPAEVIESQSDFPFANVNAVESGQVEPLFIDHIFLETWERYGCPIALMESSPHYSSGRENEMRWLNQIWDSAKKLATSGVKIEAVTASSLTGKIHQERYEPGAFDINGRDSSPRPTAISELIRSLTGQKSPESPVLHSDGVWETTRRMKWKIPLGEVSRLQHKSYTRPILITGSETNHGKAITQICGERNIAYRALRRKEMDLTDMDSIEHAIEVYQPWAIINATGFLHIDLSQSQLNELHSDSSWATNLARICHRKRISLMNFSGADSKDSKIRIPINIFRRAELQNESTILRICPNALIIRQTQYDMYVSPNYLPDFVNDCLNLLIDGEHGIVHLANGAQGSSSLKQEILSRLPSLTQYIDGLKLPLQFHQEMRL